MSRIALAALALAGALPLAAPAAAADPFQGPYVGAQVGVAHDSLGHVGSPLGGIAVDHSRDDFNGGVFAGYNYHLAPRVVVGGEAGISFGANDAIHSANGPAVIDPRRQIDVTARAGYLVSPDQLVYVRGGYTNVRTRTTIGSQAEAISRSSDLNGWTLGAGTERALTEKVSARVEYRYSDLGEGHGRFDRHQVLLGLAYHF